MSDFIIKGTVMGLTVEQCMSDPKILSSTLLVVIENWRAIFYEQDGNLKKELPEHVKKQFGEVKQALIALENDIHNLSICYKQFLHFQKDNLLESGLKTLFFGNLVESYFTNIRSIYDHIACFPRIVVDCDYSGESIPPFRCKRDQRFKV